MGHVIPIGEARSRRTAPAEPLGSVAQTVRRGERLYTAAELSKIVRRSTRSIRRDVQAGCPHVPIGAAHRFVLADVLAWHANRQAHATNTHRNSA